MSALGNRLAKPNKMGFHIPPFSSVHHLHLHVLVEPYNLRGKLKYPLSRSSRGTSKGVDQVGKGISWFVGIDQAVGILQRGGTIGLGSS